MENTSTPKRESGIALITALFILIVIMMMGIVFTMMMASETNTSVREKQSTQALYLADAGLQYAQYSAGMTGTAGRDFDTLTGSFSRIAATGQSFSVVWSGGSAAEVWASSWGYVYDSTLDYSAARHLACKLTK